MGVSEISGGAATYAMQKAQEMPKIMIDLLLGSGANGDQPLATNALAVPPAQMPDLAAVTGKGKVIDLVV